MVTPKKPRIVQGQAIPGGTPFKRGVVTNPTGKAARMITLVTIALREKLASMDPETKTTCAERIADIYYHCVIHPDPEVDKTRLMAMDQIVDRCEGKPKQQIDVNDVTADLRARSDSDLLYHLEHGHFPEESVQ